MIKNIIFILLCPLSIYSLENPLLIDAEHVVFDGKSLVCTEKVNFQSDMGNLKAEYVETSEALDFILLKNHVEIELKEGGKLTCEEAELSPSSLTVSLSGGVNFSTQNNGPITLSGKKMFMKLYSDKKHIQNFSVQDQVEFNYHNDLSMKADRANLDTFDNDLTVPVHLLLEGNCRFTDQIGDSFVASCIFFDLAKRCVVIEDPLGYLILARKSAPPEKLEVSAQTFIWDHIHKQMTLKNTISAILHDLGEFKVKDEMIIVYDKENDRNLLKKIECIGETELNMKSRIKSFHCLFKCPGKVLIDKEMQSMMMTSAGMGQILFQDNLARMMADSIYLSYVSSDEQTVLEKVILEGNVQLVSRITHLFDESRPMQYALADKIEYIPRTKELNLYSLGASRVLFLDQVNHFQISAPALRMKRSTSVQRGYIQGVGDVRFSFVKQEAELMRNTFDKESLSDASCR